MFNNKKILIICFTYFLPGIAQANNTSADGYHHNTAEVSLSTGFFSKKKLAIQIRVPTHNAYEFEGKSSNSEQEAKVNTVTDSIKQNISQIILLPPDAKCKYEVNDINQFDIGSEKYEETKKGERKIVKTSYWVLNVEADVFCNRSLLKEKITVDLSK